MISEVIPLFKVHMSQNAINAASKVLASGFIGQGPVVEEFEADLRKWLGAKYIITVNSATSAEHLAIHLLKEQYQDWPGLSEGDEVLATSLTCTATNWPILANGLKIKWVDVDPDTLNMDLNDLTQKISPKTKIIMPVLWGGYPLDLDRLREIQQIAKKKFGFEPKIIEDCAHAFGSEYKGEKIGNHGNFCTFSFQAIKHLTSVDGGILILPDERNYKRAKLIRWYGIDRESERKDFRCEEDILEWGFKFHMNDVNASIGKENLKEIDSVLQRHIENAAFYDKNLKDVPGINLLTRHPGHKSTFWLYTMLVDNKPAFMEKMKACNIMVSQVHARNDKHTCVKEFIAPLPQLDELEKRIVSIPVGWWVTAEQRQYIVDCIKQGW